MNNTMSIYAETLISNMEYKNACIDGKAVGVTEARNWRALVTSCLAPAYDIRKYRWDNMGNTEVVAPCNQTPLYDAIRPIIALIGDVNGDRLNAENVAEEFIANAMKIRVIDTSNEMAHAHSMRKSARAKLSEDASDENQANYDHWNAECKRLEALPGNCKRIPYMQAESTFVKNVEMALANAITKQTMRPRAEIEAEKAARKAERDAKRRANKLSKKNSK